MFENFHGYMRPNDPRVYYRWFQMFWREGTLLVNDFNSRACSPENLELIPESVGLIFPLLVQAVRDLASEFKSARYSKVRPASICLYHENGPKVQPADVCLYHENGPNRCGCIIGQALARLGLPVPVTVGGIAVFLGDCEDGDDPIKWLQGVQNAQDRGETWADAVTIADSGITLPPPPAIREYVAVSGRTISLCPACAEGEGEVRFSTCVPATSCDICDIIDSEIKGE